MTRPPIPEVPPPTDDGLALPIDFDAGYGAGSRRALVLGGGGIVFAPQPILDRRCMDADAIGAFLA